MDIHFEKYQGLGRDFILIDNKDGSLNAFREVDWGRICDRKFGVGASGILCVDAYSDEMIEVSSYTANGALSGWNVVDSACVAAYARNLGFCKPLIPVRINGRTAFCKIGSSHENMYFVSVTLPDSLVVKKLFQNFILDFDAVFCMVPIDGVGYLNIEEKGREISHGKRFQKGANVVFYQPHHSFLEIRSYEYQTDEESYGCGLGAIGAALSHAQNNPGQKCLVRTRGGELNVSFERSEQTFCKIELQVVINSVYAGTYKTYKPYLNNE